MKLSLACFAAVVVSLTFMLFLDWPLGTMVG
jgi:hypothetical protein